MPEPIFFTGHVGQNTVEVHCLYHPRKPATSDSPEEEAYLSNLQLNYSEESFDMEGLFLDVTAMPALAVTVAGKRVYIPMWEIFHEHISLLSSYTRTGIRPVVDILTDQAEASL